MNYKMICDIYAIKANQHFLIFQKARNSAGDLKEAHPMTLFL